MKNNLSMSEDCRCLKYNLFYYFDLGLKKIKDKLLLKKKRLNCLKKRAYLKLCFFFIIILYSDLI